MVNASTVSLLLLILLLLPFFSFIRKLPFLGRLAIRGPRGLWSRASIARPNNPRFYVLEPSKEPFLEGVCVIKKGENCYGLTRYYSLGCTRSSGGDDVVKFGENLRELHFHSGECFVWTRLVYINSRAKKKERFVSSFKRNITTNNSI